jgi:hypothetical protein
VELISVVRRPGLPESGDGAKEVGAFVAAGGRRCKPVGRGAKEVGTEGLSVPEVG